MIDPAESFSKALGQGLGIFKSYRDEARQDEDRAFEREMRLKMDARADKQLEFLANEDQRNQGEYDFEYKVDPITGKSRKQQTSDVNLKILDNQARSTGAEASAAEFNADPTRMQTMFDLNVGEKKANIRQSDASAAASRASANYSNTSAAIAREEAAERRRDRAQRQAMLQSIGFIGQTIQSGGKAPESMRGNTEVVRSAGRLAAMSLGANTFWEAVQNPFGNWLNDPKKVREVMPFAYTTVSATEKARGFKDSRIVDIDATKDGKFRLIFDGVNKQTGKRQQYTGVADPDVFFGKAFGYANLFREINRRPEARIGIARTVAAADPEIAESLLSREAKKLEARIKVAPRAERAALERRLALLESGDATVAADVIFNGMASIESTRYD